MFELSRVKLYRYDLRGNKNFFELVEGSSYRGVRVTEGKITVNVWFELARGSSYRESTVVRSYCCN